MAGVNEAMDKLRDEMAAAKDDSSIAVLGEYMTERLLGDEALAGAVLAKGKTLAGAFGAIKEYARKHQKNGFACVDEETAYKVMCEYYGIEASTPHPALCATFPSRGRQTGEASNHPQALARDALDLDALLGE